MSKARFGKKVPVPSTRAVKRQLSHFEQMDAAKEALRKALGEDAYEMVFPGSLRLEGDTLAGRRDMGPAGTKSFKFSISKGEMEWEQG